MWIAVLLLFTVQVHAAPMQMALNTLTTSCSGACNGNSACVILGSSSSNSIDCTNNTQCATLNNGRAAFCLEPFDDSTSRWAFSPADSNDSAGIAPFQRLGLLQLDKNIHDVSFERARDDQDPYNSLDVSSFNLQASGTLDSVSFTNLHLKNVASALSLTPTSKLYINRCELSSIPSQFLTPDELMTLDLSYNNIEDAGESFKNTTYRQLSTMNLTFNNLTALEGDSDSLPTLQQLYLDNNSFQSIPSFVFGLSKLQDLTMRGNPVNASDLSEDQLDFLARLRSFEIDGTTTTEACPSNKTIDQLNDSFVFCAHANDTDITIPPDVSDASDASGSNSAGVGDVEDESGLSTGEIVGIVVGSFFLLLVVILLLLWCCRKCRRRRPHDSAKLTNVTTQSMSYGMGHVLEQPYVEMSAPSPSSHNTSEFELLNSIADGYIGLTRLAYSDVLLDKMLRVSSRSELWVGEYLGQRVAVKKMKSNTASKSVMRDFVTEIELMAELQHPRIAAFKGAMWNNEGSELGAVVEYVENASLRECTKRGVAWSVPKQHAIARQLAEAISFLHDKQIVHGRLSASNVLLDRDFSAKLSLFAVFHYVKLSPLDQDRSVFAAPEVLRGEQPTDKSDVYAFGVVLVEVDTGAPPQRNADRRGRGHQVESPTAQRTGFHLSDQCSNLMKEIVVACLRKDGASRPSMHEIVGALQSGAMPL